LPIRTKNLMLLDLYERFFIAHWFSVVPIVDEVVDLATQIRADHNFKVPDAIHLATAIVQKADMFLTGDQQLTRCPGIAVEVIS
jgi:predicted nucleic acid-binding protein